MKKSINGYFKFYNKDGVSCRIKCDQEINGEVLIKFKSKDDDGWFYHSPRREFGNSLDVANFILKNLENQDMIFKVLPSSKGL